MATVIDFPGPPPTSENLPDPRLIYELVTGALNTVRFNPNDPNDVLVRVAWLAARYGQTGNEFYRERCQSLLPELRSGAIGGDT